VKGVCHGLQFWYPTVYDDIFDVICQWFVLSDVNADPFSRRELELNYNVHLYSRIDIHEANCRCSKFDALTDVYIDLSICNIQYDLASGAKV
jgi:hypothetical protein